MGRFLLCLSLAPAAWCGAIRGIVMDYQSGRPLARALVTLQAVDQGAPAVTVRATGTGQFAFVPAPKGAYLLSASRPGFATCKYGQKAWNAPGTPLVVDQDGSAFIEMRLHRLPAITGTVWDDNEVGVPEFDVVAFRATRPPVPAGRGRTDDRGNFRIHSLPPGNYFVRTAAKRLDEETSVLPTFFRDVGPVEEAREVAARIDEDTPDVNIRPLPGRLWRLSGQVANPNVAVTSIVLTSDMGQAGSTSAGAFAFDHLAPGTYELTAEGWMGRYPVFGYRRINLERDLEGVQLDLRNPPQLYISAQDQAGNRVESGRFTLLTRRRTVAGPGAVEPFKPGGYVDLPPGRWEVAVTTDASLYPVSLTINGVQGAGDVWNEAELLGFTRVAIKVSTRPATLRGRVTASQSTPAVGAPVYLEPLDVEPRRRVVAIRTALSDTRGEYRFSGLVPGRYRLVSTFEFEDPDPETMEAARPRTVSLKEANEAVEDLELYTRP